MTVIEVRLFFNIFKTSQMPLFVQFLLTFILDYIL
jgi:hypothetical protein